MPIGFVRVIISVPFSLGESLLLSKQYWYQFVSPHLEIGQLRLKAHQATTLQLGNEFSSLFNLRVLTISDSQYVVHGPQGDPKFFSEQFS